MKTVVKFIARFATIISMLILAGGIIGYSILAGLTAIQSLQLSLTVAIICISLTFIMYLEDKASEYIIEESKTKNKLNKKG